ncbi:SDR family oxidoreductase [Piscibacillus sp. B03]|uniref:SDR family oxidoreductase n=1 Tax=Piscibacillus sp. B03 TaxID=3457430 RepID=UPI003FCD1A82
MANYFFTGFPGFIAKNLIQQIIKDQDPQAIYVLVLPDMVQQAEEQIKQIIEENQIKDPFHIIPGDITRENLDIGPNILEHLQNHITHVFHLAAIYDLAVPKDIAFRVNVNGTHNVNEFVKTLNKLERYVYFSTAYVSGKRVGKILETELDCGQEFKNHYEYTKFEAEVLVKALKEEVPTTIIRPGVVCGHSKTGETLKFDGPYFMLNMFEALQRFPIPYIGKSHGLGNFVPIDYVLEATIYLAHANVGINKTYHLTDPNPYKMKEVYAMLLEGYIGKNPKWTVPLPLAKLGLSSRIIRQWLQIEKESLDYSYLIAQHDCTQTINDLEESGIKCPDFKEVVPSVIQFYRKHKDNPQYKITIS